jgi:ribosomal protein S27E
MGYTSCKQQELLFIFEAVAKRRAESMSSESRPLLVQCPKCKAATKVVGLPESKTSIHCPKCKAEVNLKLARPLKERTTPGPTPTATAADYRRTLQGKSGTARSGLWLGLLLGLILAAAATGAYLLWWPQQEEIKELPHERAYAELIRVYRDAADRMNQIPDAKAAIAWDSQLMAFQNRIGELTRRLGELPTPEGKNKERVRELEKDLDFARGLFDEARRRLTGLKAAVDPMLDPARASTSTATAPQPPPSVAASTPAPVVPSVAAAPVPTTASGFPAEKTVTLTILNFPKERFTTEFLERIGTWTDSSPHFIKPHWAGDLLTIEVAPVSDVGKFAARVNFGRVTRLDAAQRALTILARSESDPVVDVPDDPFQLLLRDLRAEDISRRKAAVQRLKVMRPNDYRREVVKVLEPMLHDKDLELRQEAIRALGQWGGADAVPSLLALLGEENPAIYRPLIDTLAVLKDPRAAEPLARRWFAREPEAVSAALIAIGPAAEGAMLEQLSQPSIPLRIAACRVLRKIGTRASLGPLLKLTDDKSSPLTEAAWEAVEAIAARKGGG